MAQVTGDVVLIDADLHHPTLSKLFKISPRSGFSEMLHSKGDSLSNTALALEGVEGLTIIPSGSRTQTPFATLAASSLASTIETLKAQHKLLIMIAPPFNQYAESLLLAASIDNTILVVHNGSNQNDLKETLAVLRSKHIRTIGAVFHRGHYSKSLNHKMQPTALPAGEKGKALVKANDS
jgi:Mrp family chromosome partitioning ATPase